MKNKLKSNMYYDKFTFIFLFTLFISIIFPSYAQDGTAKKIENPKNILHKLTENERKWLSEHPVISLGFDPAWHPIEFADEKGNFSGMIADYVNLVEKLLNIKFKRIINLSWQEVFEKQKRWEIDMGTCVASTPRRTSFWAFTKPYFNIPIVIAAPFNAAYIGDMKELNGKKVAVVKGYAIDDWLTNDYPGITLIRVNKVQDGLDLLQREEVFAYIDNLMVISDYQIKMKVSNIKIAGQTPYVNAQRMAVRKDWAILAGILNKALDSISDTERRMIYRKWLPVRYEHGFNYKLFWQILGGFLIIVLFLILWNRKLSKEIKRRKEVENELQKIEWLLKPRQLSRDSYHPAYGDITKLNTNREIIDAAGEEALLNIVNDFMGLLETSCAVYEKNGDYSLGLFSSGWCRFLDQASFELCETRDLNKAFNCGKWHCHESCWRQAAEIAIKTGKPVDIECNGKIHLYALPIRIGEEIIGAINFGYGNPPKDRVVLAEIAKKYNVTIENLIRLSEEYKTRPQFIIDLAKNRLEATGQMIALIVQRKREDYKIKNLLSEKELLLKEVHHRIKNNINTVQALITLQASSSKEPAVIAALRDAAGRVQSMHILYDKLYQSAIYKEMSVRTYLSDLIDQIIKNFPKYDIVKVKKHIDEFTLDSKILSLLGIIINELLTNIMKHAFIDRSDGTISVTVSLHGDTINMKMEDNGNGMPDYIDFKNTAGFGLKLIMMLTDQLKGRIRIERGNGTKVILEFNKYE